MAVFDGVVLCYLFPVARPMSFTPRCFALQSVCAVSVPADVCALYPRLQRRPRCSPAALIAGSRGVPSGPVSFPNQWQPPPPRPPRRSPAPGRLQGHDVGPVRSPAHLVTTPVRARRSPDSGSDSGRDDSAVWGDEDSLASEEGSIPDDFLVQGRSMSLSPPEDGRQSGVRSGRRSSQRAKASVPSGVCGFFWLLERVYGHEGDMARRRRHTHGGVGRCAHRIGLRRCAVDGGWWWWWWWGWGVMGVRRVSTFQCGRVPPSHPVSCRSIGPALAPSLLVRLLSLREHRRRGCPVSWAARAPTATAIATRKKASPLGPPLMWTTAGCHRDRLSPPPHHTHASAAPTLSFPCHCVHAVNVPRRRRGCVVRGACPQPCRFGTVDPLLARPSLHLPDFARIVMAPTPVTAVCRFLHRMRSHAAWPCPASTAPKAASRQREHQRQAAPVQRQWRRRRWHWYRPGPRGPAPRAVPRRWQRQAPAQ
jgi:hypothetical protein